MEENILGNNIRCLRKMCHESQSDLAQILYCTKSTISDYEKGKVIPKTDVLKVLANHYRITVDELTNTNLSGIENKKFDADELDRFIDGIDVAFPSFDIEDGNIQDSHLKSFCTLCKRIKRSLRNKEEVEGTLLKMLFDEMVEIDDVNEEDEPALVANIIWCFMLLWISLANEKWQRDIQIKYDLKKISIVDYLSYESNMPVEDIERRKDFIKSFDSIIIESIQNLKNNPDWCDIGDYYLAQKYLQGIVDNTLSLEMNKSIGMELMTTFALMSNKYAINYLKLIK